MPFEERRPPEDRPVMTSRPDMPARTKKLVLFDFDGTITRRDTLVEFTRFYCGSARYARGLLLLAPTLALFKAGMIPNGRAKQYYLSHFFKGEKLSSFNERCRAFSTEVLPALVRPGALQAIEHYRNEQATVVVVSASAENWVKPWCDQYGFVCLATRLESKDGYITGKIEGSNCYGDEKVCRIQEHINIREFDEVIAYGDSRGDREMLNLAHHRFYKPFRRKSVSFAKS